MDEKLEKFTDVTNRSVRQTNFLLGLLEGNFERLVELEEKLKNNFIFYCPGDLETVEEIMNTSNGNGNWFNLNEFKS